MRKLTIVAVAAMVCLVGVETASARGGRGGCGGGGCGGGGGYSAGGCGSGGCGYGGGYGVSYGGGCGSGGCGYGASYGGCGATYGGHGVGGYGAPPIGYAGCGYGSPITPHVTPVVPKTDGKKGDKEEQISAPATMVVTLPADATLKVDDYQTTSTSETRVFTTPELKAGKDYSYTLKAEVIRDGKPVVVEQVVKVRAGETTPVVLNVGAAAGVASR